MNCAREPSMAKNSSPSRLRNWRSTPDNLEEREKWPKKAEKPFITAAITTTAKSRVPISVATGMSTDSGDELNLGHFHCRNTQRHCMITGTSITVDELRQQGHRPPPGICYCTQRACNNSVHAQRAATVGARLSPHRLHPKLLDLHNRHRTPESLWCSEQDQGKLPLRHDRDVTTLTRRLRTWRCTITGMSNPVHERHLRNLDGELHSLHCG